ncbi:sensor histidine kinase [Corynebacterium kutscheri]|uniref:Sensor-like histidine kinase SenX3 n=1 Tax=Corynebacterium kutscheri TaxID=35755 RepID=A0A0F6QYB7_9CORY|nr:ATP-binding protein [Corynebacterium kutscheri]AKE40472.1 histidine kinase [Corynebacterium kutscheri]VEH10866.1 Signal-transduction histidine kinase senX3 [Corynebacterium kutscheri]
MTTLVAFLLGVTLMGLALLAFQGMRRRITSRYKNVDAVSRVLQLSVQEAPIGITVIDHNEDINLCNYRAQDMGVVHNQMLHQEIRPLVKQCFTDRETRICDFTPIKKRLRVTSVRAIIQPLVLNDDCFVIIYSTDESENVRMEAARRDFVANVSHELKTPVGGVALLTEALLEGTDDREHVEYFATLIHKEALRLGEMITELISLSKLQGAEALPDMQPVLVDDIVSDAVNRNKVAADAAEIVLTRKNKSGAMVMGDRLLLVTAVSNLISNAINYSPAKMPVIVATEVIEDTVHIQVRDQGIGIAPKYQERVFERFFRVDKARSRSTGGTGLGLAIVKHVTANHDGEVTLHSELSKGATFTMKLPIYRGMQ